MKLLYPKSYILKQKRIKLQALNQFKWKRFILV